MVSFIVLYVIRQSICIYQLIPYNIIIYFNIIMCTSIFFIVSSVDVTINVMSSREGTFTVTCTASGGTVVSSSLTGPGGEALELQPVGSIGRTGQNTYSVTSGTLSERNNGDTYHCTAAANLSSPSLSDSDNTVLRGMHNYTYYHRCIFMSTIIVGI